MASTVRDRVWGAAHDLATERGRFRVGDVLDAAGLGEPQHETARDVLNVMTAQGVLDHEHGSPYWRHRVGSGPRLTYLRDRNNSEWTFRDRRIREWVEDRLAGRVLNLFAGVTRLDHDGEVVRNDSRSSITADHHFDAVEVADHLPPDSFDTVVADPPWSGGIEKRRPKYGGEYVDDYTTMKNGVAEVVRPGGRVISLGYDSSGLGERRGFDLVEVCLIHFSGNSNDATITVEHRRE